MPDILIVGIAVVDAVARPVDDFPAPGGLRFFDDLTFTTGGCAVNSAIALAKLGVEADVVARVGADPLGDFVIAELTRNGVSPARIVRDTARSTSFSFVAVPRGGERAFIHTTGANATLNVQDIPHAVLHAKKVVFVTGTMLMDALDGAGAATLLRQTRRAGATTLMDTVFVENLPSLEWRRRVGPALENLDYFIPSEPEARALSGHNDPLAAARSFQGDGARNVVVKLGDRGVLCLDSGGRDTLVPAFAVPKVVDATGAGDCWAAGFIAGLREGRAFPDAARLGNAVAAVSVQAPGATTGITGMPQVLGLLQRSSSAAASS